MKKILSVQKLANAFKIFELPFFLKQGLPKEFGSKPFFGITFDVSSKSDLPLEILMIVEFLCKNNGTLVIADDFISMSRSFNKRGGGLSQESIDFMSEQLTMICESYNVAVLKTSKLSENIERYLETDSYLEREVLVCKKLFQLGFDVKVGPTQEECFDKKICEFGNVLEIPFFAHTCEYQNIVPYLRQSRGLRSEGRITLGSLKPTIINLLSLSNPRVIEYYAEFCGMSEEFSEINFDKCNKPRKKKFVKKLAGKLYEKLGRFR